MQSSFETILTAYLRVMNRLYFRLDRLNAAALPGPRPGREYLLYVHVPFCLNLCPYCSFNRYLFKEQPARAYFEQLRQEIRMAAGLGYAFQSMYIGGGTPTILVDELCETIDLARELFPIADVSCETNPNHLTPQVFDLLGERVQRMSVGVQSFDDELLKQLNRYQTVGSSQETFEHIQAAAGRFPALNVDLIFNFPNQTEQVVRNDVERVIASGANQATFYPLMSSPSVARSLARTVGKAGADCEARFYDVICEELSREFTPMSAWTFSRTGGGMLDEYIVDYEEYVGLGSGAFSYLDGALYVNTFSLREYEQALTSGRMSVSARRQFKRYDRMRYRFLMDLFSLQLDKQRFRRDFGVSVERGLWEEMTFMRLAGAFERNDEQLITLTPQGRYLLVAMMREFFCGVNHVRDQARLALTPDERLRFCTVKSRA